MPMLDKYKLTNPYHPDVVLFLVLIPFISAINYYLTYTNIRLSWFLALTFSLDTVEGYLAWWGVRSYIFFLDKKLPYERNFARRITIQLAGSMILGLTVIAVLTELVSWMARGRPAPLNFYTIDLVIISIWFFVITGIYTGLHYYNLWKWSEEQRREERRLKSDGLLVKQGKSEIRLTFPELAGLCVEGEYAVACHISGKKYYVDQSLDKIEKVLPTTFFFRLNRQFILHRQAVSGFKRAENGKIMVLPKNVDSFPPEIPVSRTKAPSFKGWFRPE
jgi:DNA-binding LytR/AlgR family response regulator